MTTYVLRNVDTGEYIAGYDPDWQPDPLPLGSPPWHCGRVDWTTDPAKALQFVHADDAIDLWRSQSTKHPIRGDGRPNRPLTAHTILLDPWPGAD